MTKDKKAQRERVGRWLIEKGVDGSAGMEQASVTIEGFQIDLNFCTEEEYGCRILHCTGSKEHNIKMRAIAKRKGYKLKW